MPLSNKNNNSSRHIASTQDDIHPNLEKLLTRHRSAMELEVPIPEHTKAAFGQFLAVYRQPRWEGVILDTGCGTGKSTIILAKNSPASLVVGIDKSKVRLQKSELKTTLPDNALFLRADVFAFVRLLWQENTVLQKAYFLYPNPWPKPAHIGRRWQGHPVFPLLLSLAKTLELRTNWAIYAREFAFAAAFLYPKSCVEEEVFSPEEALTLFEKKYQQSQHTLYRCVVSITQTASHR